MAAQDRKGGYPGWFWAVPVVVSLGIGLLGGALQALLGVPTFLLVALAFLLGVVVEVWVRSW